MRYVDKEVTEPNDQERRGVFNIGNCQSQKLKK